MKRFNIISLSGTEILDFDVGSFDELRREFGKHFPMSDTWLERHCASLWNGNALVLPVEGVLVLPEPPKRRKRQKVV